MRRSLGGRVVVVVSLLVACGCGEPDEPARPAGTVLHTARAFTYGENTLTDLDEQHSATARVSLRPEGGGTAVAVAIEMTLGVADVTYASDGSRVRRRAPRALSVRLSDATALLDRATCAPELSGPIEDPPATLFTRCSFTLRGEGEGSRVLAVDVLGNGDVRPASASDTGSITVQLATPVLPALPGDRPGMLEQFVVEGDQGSFRVLADRPEGAAIVLAPPVASRTLLTLTVSQSRVEMAVHRVDGTEVAEGEPRSVAIEGPLEAASLEPLFAGHEGWEAPVAATLEVPASTSYSDVRTLIDAVHEHSVERVRLAVQ